MLNLANCELIVDKAEKRNSPDIQKYILTLIRRAELTYYLNKESFRKNREALYKAYPNIDIMRCEKVLVYRILNKKTDQFVKDREEVNSLQEICRSLPTMQEILALSLTDKAHVMLMAHVIYKNVVFDNEIFNLFQEEIKALIASLKNSIFQRQARNRLKKDIADCLHKMLSQEGKYFYGIKVKASDIEAFDIMSFLSQLYNGVSPVMAFTDLCAVILYGENTTYKVLNDSSEIAIKKIEVNTFIIKCHVFRCIYEGHKLNDIIAVIDIIDNNGKKKAEKVPAGYCPDCNMFFILESTFEDLKKKGIILCKITDIKNISKNMHMNGEKFAHESVLMQYGYNVSQVNGLSSESRKKILAAIIDNKIVSKSEIISYLDLFIKQRVSMSNMQRAIAKWKEDREFVRNYGSKQYTEVDVKALYRK